jgi:glycosyltransferase involved in cell wall biosynthesis
MKLSIITVCLNDHDGLRKTVNSVLTQTFTDVEHIIIDGGSSDGSLDYIKSIAGKLAYWVSEKDNGIYHAMNKGIEKAVGDFFLFLNSGDFLASPDVLQKVFSREYAESLLYGDMIIDYGDKKITATQPDIITFEFLVLTTVWHPVTFFAKKLFNKYGKYNEDLRIVSDYEFILKVLIVNNEPALHLSIPVSVFNTNGIGSDPKYKVQQDQERISVLIKYFPIKVIQSAQQYNLLKLSKAVVLTGWLKDKPVLLNIAAIFYNLLNSIRKLFSR